MNNPTFLSPATLATLLLAAAPAALLTTAPALADTAAKAGELKDYKDWEIGCDNTRSCVAIGMTSEDSSLSGYLRIARSGEPNAVPDVTFTVYPPDDTTNKLKKPMVRLSLDAHKAGGLPSGALPLTEAGDLFELKLAPEALPDLLAALRSATKITMDLYDGTKKVGSQVVSLAGSSAALLQMDDQQKRIGTVTALVKKGDAGADTIPPVPALPKVKSLPVSEMADPLPKPPRTAAKPTPDGCGEGPAPYVAFKLPGGASLWGTCASAGAYNFAYDYRLFVDGKPGRPWDAIVPGTKRGGEGDDITWLWNAYVDDQTQRLNSYMKGRGLGDCGDATEWAFDGQNFAALTYIAMGQCRGVMQDDWPVLYRAEAE